MYRSLYYPALLHFTVLCCLVPKSCLTATPWTAACQAYLSFTISRNLLRLMSIESGLPYNHLLLCYPLLPLLSLFPTIRVFSNDSALCIRWPKNCSFNFSISSSNKYSGLIPLDWLAGSSCSPRDSQDSSLAPQFESINWIESINSLVISLLYGPTLTSTTGKTIALIVQTCVGKVTSLLFITLSRFV